MRSFLASLRVRFVVLALLAVLPALGLLFYTLEEQRDEAVRRARDEVGRLTSVAASDQVGLIENTRQLLLVLAELPQVRSADAAACSDLMADLLSDTPRYTNLGAITPAGSLFCSAVATEQRTNLLGQEFFLRAAQQHEFAVGSYQEGVVTPGASLNCGYPVLDGDGTLIGVVYAALDPDAFLTDGDLAEGTVLTIVDRHGRVLARSPDPEGEWQGDSLRPSPLVDQMLAGRTDTAELPNEDGKPYLYGFAPLGDDAPYAYLSVGIPRATAIDSANEAFNDNLTWLGLVTALALVAAWVGGDLLASRDTEANKALVQRVYDAFRLGNVDQLDEVVAADFVDHDPMPGQAPGLVGLKQAVGLFRGAFPDGRLTVEELIAEADKVVARVTMRGTQAGEFYGLPPTGEVMTTDGVETFLVRRGKLVESWSRFGGLTPVPAASERSLGHAEGSEESARHENGTIPRFSRNDGMGARHDEMGAGHDRVRARHGEGDGARQNGWRGRLPRRPREAARALRRIVGRRHV